MDYSKLVPELRDDPLGRGYAAMGKTMALADLHTLYRTKSRQLLGEHLLRWLAGKGKLPVIAALKADPDPAKANLGLTIEALISRAGTAVDLSNPVDAGLAQYAVAVGLLTSDEAAELTALCLEPCTRAEELGISDVGAGHIASAWEMI